MTPFQPIATAPKDGTMVLGYSRYPGLVASYESMVWLGFWCSTTNGARMNFPPTHWMPLPEPPT